MPHFRFNADVKHPTAKVEGPTRAYVIGICDSFDAPLERADFLVLNELDPEYVQMTIDQSLLSKSLLSLPKGNKRKVKGKISDNYVSAGASASPRASKRT